MPEQTQFPLSEPTDPGSVKGRIVAKATSVRAICLLSLVAVVCVVNLAIGLSAVFRPGTVIELAPVYVRMLDTLMGAILGSYLTKSAGSPPAPANGGAK